MIHLVVHCCSTKISIKIKVKIIYLVIGEGILILLRKLSIKLKYKLNENCYFFSEKYKYYSSITFCVIILYIVIIHHTPLSIK